MDRKFIGQEGLACLKGKSIAFCVLIHKYHNILLLNGAHLKIKETMKQNNKHYYQQEVVVGGVVVNLIFISSDGELLLYLFETSEPQSLKLWYKRPHSS